MLNETQRSESVKLSELPITRSYMVQENILLEILLFSISCDSYFTGKNSLRLWNERKKNAERSEGTLSQTST